MSSEENVMEIEFLDNKNNKRRITLPKKYSDFIDLLKKTFFISDERFDNISLFYFDGEDDVPLEEEDYTSKDARKATYWKLSENENEDDGNNDTLSSAKEELMNYKTMILTEAKKFKDDLYKKYSKIAEEQIKEKNKKHEEEKEKIKKDYILFLFHSFFHLNILLHILIHDYNYILFHFHFFFLLNILLHI